MISNVFSGPSRTNVLLLRNVSILSRSISNANEYLVAATVAAEKGILVTGNLREFNKVPGLKPVRAFTRFP